MDATFCRLRPLMRPLLSSPYFRTFSSSSNYKSYRARPLVFGDPEKRGTGSAVYRHSLKTQRPPTIRWQKDLENRASFIGRVTSPVKMSTKKGGILCAYTQLRVETPSGSNKCLTIFVDMWEEMAELCIQHLKLYDYIYVSGYLHSYTKALANGNIILQHKVNVKEINFVADNNKNSQIIKGAGEWSLEKSRKRLHLWQVFFSNPHEWRDLRKNKTNPRLPDFKNKVTGEALWLSMYDPPWVTRQLQLQDSRMGDMGLGQHPKYPSSLSPMRYDDT